MLLLLLFWLEIISLHCGYVLSLSKQISRRIEKVGVTRDGNSCRSASEPLARLFRRERQTLSLEHPRRWICPSFFGQFFLLLLLKQTQVEINVRARTWCKTYFNKQDGCRHLYVVALSFAHHRPSRLKGFASGRCW